jgi:hypothetical protein
MLEDNYMLQSDRKPNKDLSQGMNSEEKTHQLVQQSPKADGDPTCRLHDKNNRRIESNRKRDFVSLVYRDTGFICEV